MVKYLFGTNSKLGLIILRLLSNNPFFKETNFCHFYMVGLYIFQYNVYNSRDLWAKSLFSGLLGLITAIYINGNIITHLYVEYPTFSSCISRFTM